MQGLASSTFGDVWLQHCAFHTCSTRLSLTAWALELYHAVETPTVFLCYYAETRRCNFARLPTWEDASAGFVDVVVSLPPHLQSEGSSFPRASCSSEPLAKDSRLFQGGATDGAGWDEEREPSSSFRLSQRKAGFVRPLQSCVLELDHQDWPDQSGRVWNGAAFLMVCVEVELSWRPSHVTQQSASLVLVLQIAFT